MRLNIQRRVGKMALADRLDALKALLDAHDEKRRAKKRAYDAERPERHAGDSARRRLGELGRRNFAPFKINDLTGEDCGREDH
jgi:hypothetical protein